MIKEYQHGFAWLFRHEAAGNDATQFRILTYNQLDKTCESNSLKLVRTQSQQLFVLEKFI